MMDFTLGFGSYEGPVGVILNTIVKAKEVAAADGRPPGVLGYVPGTDLDTPSLKEQCQMLVDAEVIWVSSSTNTGLLVRGLIFKGEEGWRARHCLVSR